jgi:signal transduction histidine kinase
MEALREARLREKRRLEDLRAELLHRTVTAQESERQRIARELHDETGQTLTALGMGLRGLSETIENNPTRAVEQANQLEKLAVAGIDELQRMVAGLRPPQLDDLGLRAALRWYAKEITSIYKIPVNVESIGNSPGLPQEISVVFFRIAQEAITNAIRHAHANQINVALENSDNQIRLTVSDDGVGFEVGKNLAISAQQQHWGLLGMQERATIMGGECEISSYPGLGTKIEVWINKNRLENEPH